MSFVKALQQAGLIDLSADSPRPVPCFQNAHEEYQAASVSAAIAVEHGFGMLTVTGNDRAKFLHNFCTSGVNAMQPGDVSEAFFCNVKGRILALGIMICQPERFLILTDASRIEFLHQHLDRYVISEDVTLTIPDDQTGLFLFVGPKSEELVANQEGITVAPWDGWNVPARWVIGPTETLVRIAKDCVESGVILAGHETTATLRISAGYPRYNVDVSDDNLAQEANRTDKAISFTKGCYLGQEPIARLDAMGHVNRQLQRLSYASDSPLPAGSTVRSAAGDEFGSVTSSCLIPGTNRGVALAMLKVKAAQADELLAVAEDGTTAAVELLQR